jgi:hypothetical protein
MISSYEYFGVKTMSRTSPTLNTEPENTPILIPSGHTPKELERWKHAKILAIQTMDRARSMVEWADKEIARLEQIGG